MAPFRILKGIEVNVRPDGTLDVSEEELATRDWVVASVHSRFDHDATERVLAAMESPYVDCIGHLTNRKIGKRDAGAGRRRACDREGARDGDVPRDQLAARPARPDRRNARAAREAGLKLVIDSDGHEIGALDYVELGVGQARRAWLTKDDVLNTRTWKQIEKLKKKR